MRTVMLLFSLLVSGLLHAQSLELIAPGHHVHLNLADMKSKLKTYTMKMDDPAYKKPREFDMFLFSDVLKLAGISLEQHADEVVFTAVDGYAPNTTVAKLKAHVSYLAYQDHATPGRFAWVDQGKSSVSPWPFYLLWAEGARKLKEEVPWPYQLQKIEFVDWAVKFPHIVPKNLADDSDAMKGFVLFKAQCMRCHSMNGEGGVLGPELNIPKNITEYWAQPTLKAFIKNVASFRAKDKMPQFTDLSDPQLDQILAYLKAMKENKI